MFKKSNVFYIIILLGLCFMVTIIGKIGESSSSGGSPVLMIIYIVFAVAYISALVWYLTGLFREQKEEKEKPPERKRKKKKKKKHREGKHCPGCNKMIDHRRTVCQHCGQKFELEEGVEPHPSEIKNNREKQTADEED